MEDMVRGDGQCWGGGMCGKHCLSFGLVYKNCLSLWVLKAGDSCRSYLGRNLVLLALRRISVEIWFNSWHLQLQLTRGWGLKRGALSSCCVLVPHWQHRLTQGRAGLGVHGLEGVTAPGG